MEKNNIVWIAAALVVTAGFLLAITIGQGGRTAGPSASGGASSPQVSPQGATSQVAGPSAGKLKTVTSGSTDSGDVSIDLTPHASIEAGKLVVDIAVNTHSVDLTRYDLRSLTALEVGAASLRPVAALKLQGHHSSGTLVFETGTMPQAFTIRIRGIPAVEERVFSW